MERTFTYEEAEACVVEGMTKAETSEPIASDPVSLTLLATLKIVAGERILAEFRALAEAKEAEGA